MRRTSFAFSLALGASLALFTGCGTSDAAVDDESALSETSPSRRLRVEDGRFVDPATGQTVTLRGANLAGTAKTPPFLPFGDVTGPELLDHFALLGAHGINSLRLTFFWEAYEPERGRFDEGYLDRMVAIAEAAARKNLYVVVDVHQDLFSRHAGKGCGSGFPRWTVPERFRAPAPLNPGPGCGAAWTNEVISSSVKGAFDAFYANEGGVRDAYLEMLEKVMARMKAAPTVLGIDPLNEPIYDLLSDLGGERGSQLGSLYRDAAERVRGVFPEATMFLEGHIWTNNGGVFQPLPPPLPAIGAPVTLPKPSFGNVVYAPHLYHVETMRTHRFKVEDRSFVFSQEMDNVAKVGEAWNAPVWLGEFGIFADTSNANDYFDTLYARMNRAGIHGAVWNTSPRWGTDGRQDDGWNSEDLSIVDGRTHTIRSFYRASAYAERIAGHAGRVSDAQDVAGGARTLTLEASASAGDRERGARSVIFVPRAPKAVRATGAACVDGTTTSGGRAVVCTLAREGTYAVAIEY